MRSILHSADDFVGLGNQNKGVMILLQTDLGEALQVLYRIQDYYDGNLLKLEIFSTIPSETPIISALLTQITGHFPEFN